MTASGKATPGTKPASSDSIGNFCTGQCAHSTLSPRSAPLLAVGDNFRLRGSLCKPNPSAEAVAVGQPALRRGTEHQWDACEDSQLLIHACPEISLRPTVSGTLSGRLKDILGLTARMPQARPRPRLDQSSARSPESLAGPSTSSSPRRRSPLMCRQTPKTAQCGPLKLVTSQQ